MQSIEEWTQELKTSDKLIIVEGKKDKKALEELGITNLITISKPLYEVVEQISDKTKEIIILTDMDPEGRKLYSKLKTQLQKRKIKIDTKFREFLIRETKLTNIEGLPHYLLKIK
ncbi:toprim domain-containing protein [Candidatus Woesearchaeota archaeon]|nr:toprim domain-containing protein [Candidatus Woesearchaeota archaeon]